ncbi:MAG: cytochrome C peroxidase [Burkholderiales bacterium]|nr:cytochrome C peroxidase [Opitutaceae bacterium]
MVKFSRLPFLFACVGLIANSASAADLTLAFRAVADTAPLALDAPETLRPLGPNQLSVTRVSALVSSVAFVRPDGSFAQLEGQFGAIDLASGRDRFTLRGVPPGRYQGLQFLIGLRPVANHGDPGQWPARHPLNPLVNGLHWDWQGGYIFLALEGRYRRPDGALGGWSYHLATDARLTLVVLPHPLEITADSTLALDLDLARVLDGLSLAPDTDSTHSRPGDVVADRLAQNLPTAFRVTAFTQSSAGFQPVSVPAPSDIGHWSLGIDHSKGRATAQPFVLPPGFPQIELPADNPLTIEGAELGRRLFSDKRLSGDGTQSCADCHQPAHAFSDPRVLSLGIAGLPGTRHSMPLFNLAWSPNYAWDGSQPRIRDQALAAMRNPLEMHADPDKVAVTLAADPAMSAAFESAFGPAPAASAIGHWSLVIGHSSAAPPSPVTSPRLAAALEQFLLTQVSADSRFDRALRGEAELTEQEKEGFALFATEFDPGRGQRGADCFHCHGGPLFSDYQPKHNGLDLVSKDQGRAKVTGAPADAGKFKTPSLRNVALTTPYMHDGRFKTLEEVIAHYDHGVARAPNLDPNLAKHPPEGLSLTAADKSALLAFLHTLTDERFASDAR